MDAIITRTEAETVIKLLQTLLISGDSITFGKEDAIETVISALSATEISIEG